MNMDDSFASFDNYDGTQYGITYDASSVSTNDASGSYVYNLEKNPSNSNFSEYYIDPKFYLQSQILAQNNNIEEPTEILVPSFVYSEEKHNLEINHCMINHCMINLCSVFLAVIVFIMCIFLLPGSLKIINEYNEEILCITNSNGRNPSCIVPYYLSPNEIRGNYTCGVPTDGIYGTTCPNHYTCESFVNQTLTDGNKSCGNYDICKRYEGDPYYFYCCNKWYPTEYNTIYYTYFCINNDVVGVTNDTTIMTDCTNISIDNIFQQINTYFINLINTLIILCSLIIFTISGTMICVPKHRIKFYSGANIFFKAIVIFSLLILIIFFMSNYFIVSFEIFEYTQCFELVNENIFEKIINNSAMAIICLFLMILIWLILLVMPLCVDAWNL